MAMSRIALAQSQAAERRADERADVEAEAAGEARRQARADDLAARQDAARLPAQIAACNEALSHADDRGLDQARSKFDALLAADKVDVGKLFAAWLDWRERSASAAAIRRVVGESLARLQPSGPRRVTFGEDALAGVSFAEATDLETRILDLIKPGVDGAVNEVWASIAEAGDQAAANTLAAH
jgi:hypothetical protein